MSMMFSSCDIFNQDIYIKHVNVFQVSNNTIVSIFYYILKGGSSKYLLKHKFVSSMFSWNNVSDNVLV